MTRIRTSKLRSGLSGALKRVAARKERVIVEQRGHDIAAIVPIDDLRRLERMAESDQDREDVEEAERRLADPAEKPVPYHKARKALGLA